MISCFKLLWSYLDHVSEPNIDNHLHYQACLIKGVSYDTILTSIATELLEECLEAHNQV